jgi:hypothetical protein
MIVVEAACVASQECQLQSHPCRLLLFEILIWDAETKFPKSGWKCWGLHQSTNKKTHFDIFFSKKKKKKLWKTEYICEEGRVLDWDVLF